MGHQRAAGLCLPPFFIWSHRPLVKRLIIVGLGCVCFFVAAGCGLNFGGKPLAKVNGEMLNEKTLLVKAKLYNVTLAKEEDTRIFLNLLINNMLILEKAEQDNIKVTTEDLDVEIKNFVPGYSKKEIKKVLKEAGLRYTDWLIDIKEKLIIKKEINYVMKNRITINRQELKDYFWTNILEFRTLDRAKARQIVVDSLEKIKSVQKELKAGKDFAGLAVKYSTGSEAKAGGDLGYFSKRDLPYFMTNVIFQMKNGSFSGIVISPYGYHIFKLEDLQKARTPKFEQVQAQVYEACFNEKKDRYFEEWMKELRKTAKIEIIKYKKDHI